MATKTIILLPSGITVPNLGADNYPTFPMPDNADTECLVPWQGGVPVDFKSVYSVELIIKTENAGNLYLKGSTTRFDAATPGTVQSSAGTLAAYAGGTADSKSKFIAIPSTMWSSLAALNPGDILNFVIERDATNALDTYATDLNVIGLRVVYNLNPAAGTGIDLVSLTTVKEFMNIASSDTANDGLFQTWLTWISEMIETECNRKFQLQTITGEILNGNGTREIYPRWAPVYSFVTADITQDVMIRTDPSASWEVLESTASMILLDPAQAWKIILWQSYFTAGIQNIKLNYITGYATVPASIQRACLDAIQIMWDKSRKGANVLMKSSTGGSVAGSFNTIYKDMSKESHDALNQYRRLI